MPSPFKVREALGIKPRLDGNRQLNVASSGPARTPSPVLPMTAIRFDKPHALSLCELTLPLIQGSLTTLPSSELSSNTWRGLIRLKESPSRKPIRTLQLKTSSQRSRNSITPTIRRQHV